jgi:hypothetical protein
MLLLTGNPVYAAIGKGLTIIKSGLGVNPIMGGGLLPPAGAEVSI